MSGKSGIAVVVDDGPAVPADLVPGDVVGLLAVFAGGAPIGRDPLGETRTDGRVIESRGSRRPLPTRERGIGGGVRPEAHDALAPAG